VKKSNWTTGRRLPSAPPQYLGPVISATRNTPVRILFHNYLPSTANGGDLAIPVDTSVMGAGTGPNAMLPVTDPNYSPAGYAQN
jgi:hypothetical protein